MELYTFAISHFSEKARWALDLSGVPYQERLLLPGPHMLQTRRMAKGTSVPILRDRSRTIQGSSEILDYVGDELGLTAFESARSWQSGSRELERLFDVAFGRGVQRIAYGTLLATRRDYVQELWAYGGPPWAKRFYGVAYPVVAQAVSRMYKTKDRPAVDRAVAKFDEAMDRADARLRDAPYLVGDAPGRADITLAALLAPLCRPEGHPLPSPPTPPELKSLIAQYAERPAMQHVHKMYREHRHKHAPYQLGQGGAHVPAAA